MRSLVLLLSVLVTGNVTAEDGSPKRWPSVKKMNDGRYEVRFRYRPEDGARTVALAGSFNNWNRSNLPLAGPDDNGWYSRTMEMSAGRYEYKFVVNGDQWRPDPENPERTGLHGNSVVRIGQSGRPAKVDEPQRVRFAWFVDFSPDGKWLVASYGGWDADEHGEVRVWDVATGEPKFVIPGRRGVRSATWSPNGTYFASGDYGGEIRLYDADSGKTKLEIAGRGDSAELVQITPDKRRIIAGSGSGEIRVFDTTTGKLVRTMSGHSGEVWGMRLATDGKQLASAGRDRTVRVWSVETGQQRYLLRHPQPTNGVAFTSDGLRLVTGCWDGVIRLWDLETGKELRSWNAHQSSINDFDFSPTEDLLVSSGGDHLVRLWNVETGRSETILIGHREGVYGVRFSPDGKLLASASWDATIKLWDVHEKKELMTLQR